MSHIDTSKLPQKAPEYSPEELMELGCHFGHQVKHWNPQMKEWIHTSIDGVHIFDLFKTADQLQVAYNYLYTLGKANKNIIFVGTKRSAKEIIAKEAQRAGVFYINARWLGGLFTNWEQVSKSLRRMTKIEEGLKSGAFEEYTKYERVQLDKERARLERFFGGLRSMKKLPDAIFVVDPSQEEIAVKEAQLCNVPIVALADSDADARLLDIVIPSNDDAQRCVEYMVTQMADAYVAGKNSK